jgi:hypothetical protein
MHVHVHGCQQSWLPWHACMADMNRLAAMTCTTACMADMNAASVVAACCQYACAVRWVGCELWGGHVYALSEGPGQV